MTLSALTAVPGSGEKICGDVDGHCTAARLQGG